jgi:hypothetical protein
VNTPIHGLHLSASCLGEVHRNLSYTLRKYWICLSEMLASIENTFKKTFAFGMDTFGFKF